MYVSYGMMHEGVRSLGLVSHLHLPWSGPDQSYSLGFEWNHMHSLFRGKTIWNTVSLSLGGLVTALYSLKRNSWEYTAISGYILSSSFSVANPRHTKYSQSQGQASCVSSTPVSHHSFMLLKNWLFAIFYYIFMNHLLTPEQHKEFKSRPFNVLSARTWPLLFPNLALDVLPRPLPLHLRVLTESLPH